MILVTKMTNVKNYNNIVIVVKVKWANGLKIERFYTMNKEESKKRFGERVRFARHMLGLNQYQLAEKLNVSQGVISNVETGVSGVDVADLPEWAAALNQPMLYFFMDEVDTLQEQVLCLLSMFKSEDLPLAMKLMESLAITLKDEV